MDPTALGALGGSQPKPARCVSLLLKTQGEEKKMFPYRNKGSNNPISKKPSQQHLIVKPSYTDCFSQTFLFLVEPQFLLSAAD